eukprot:5315947-Amphidinium_carterae.1
MKNAKQGMETLTVCHEGSAFVGRLPDYLRTEQNHLPKLQSRFEVQRNVFHPRNPSPNPKLKLAIRPHPAQFEKNRSKGVVSVLGYYAQSYKAPHFHRACCDALSSSPDVKHAIWTHTVVQ